MTSSSGALADASQLQSLEAKMGGYEEERVKVLGRIERLENKEAPTDEDREEVKRLQQKEQSLLDYITQLQENKNLLLRSFESRPPPSSSGLQHLTAGAAGTVVVHVKTGRKEKRVAVAAVNGQLSLLPLEQSLNVTFERIAVVGCPGNSNSATSNPEYKEFDAYDMAVQPGQEVFVEAKPTGGNWLVRAMGL